MIVDFKGRKIKGIYHLINTAKISGKKSDYKHQQYILFKGKEDKLNEYLNYLQRRIYA